jgi:hypothetical protein
MPATTTDWLVGSFRQPNAALLTAVRPQICASTRPRRDPRDPQCLAATWARRLQLTGQPLLAMRDAICGNTKRPQRADAGLRLLQGRAVPRRGRTCSMRGGASRRYKQDSPATKGKLPNERSRMRIVNRTFKIGGFLDVQFGVPIFRYDEP